MASSSPEKSVIEVQRAKATLLYKEELAPGLSVEMSLKRVLVSTESEFQKVDVIETYYGKMLVTDGKTQSTEYDEFVYHESLVHPALLKVASGGRPPKNVFIGGGGELATAREALRHKSVERVVMVDLDGKVVDLCKEYLPEWGGEKVLNDPRFELVVDDAHEYMLNTTEMFDAIIMDISDPIEAGPGIALYTKEFYEHAMTRLNPGGVFVTQAGLAESVPVSSIDIGIVQVEPSCFAPIRNTLQAVFDCSVAYTSNIPSFVSDWGFVMAFQAEDAKAAAEAWRFPSSRDTIDTLIDQSITGGSDALKYYDGITHLTMFALTKPLRKYIRNDDRIMTKDNPIFMY